MTEGNSVWQKKILHISEFFKVKNNAVEQEETKIFLKKQLSVSYFNLISI